MSINGLLNLKAVNFISNTQEMLKKLMLKIVKIFGNILFFFRN